MTRIVWGEDERVGHWAAERMGGTFDKRSGNAIGLERDGQLIAGVIFDTWNVHSIAMHVAAVGPNWLNRAYMRACFSYAFDQLKVHKVLGWVDSRNLKARRFDEHLGFVVEGVIKDAGRHGDILIYSMTRQQCRTLEARYGQQSTVRA